MHTMLRHSASFGDCRLASPTVCVSFDLPRPRTRDVKVTCAPQRLRRRWYIRKHWAHRFVPEVFFAAENFLRRERAENERARLDRYQGCTRSTRTLNYRSLSSQRKLVYKIVEYDVIWDRSSPLLRTTPLTRKHRRKTINIFALLVWRDISRVLVYRIGSIGSIVHQKKKST